MSDYNTYQWEGRHGDIENDAVDYLRKTDERKRSAYKIWLSRTPICGTCKERNTGRNPNPRCFKCECTAGTLPIYALNLVQFGREKTWEK